MSEAEVIDEYPQLAPEDIRAAIAYGGEMARERSDQTPVGPEHRMD